MRPDDVSRAVVDGLGAIVWEATPGREPGVAHFSFVSDGTTGMLGYPPERWTEDPRFWLEICHPDDRERVVAEIVAAVRDGRGSDFEFRALHADGRMLWLRDIVRVSTASPTPRMSGVVVDVTARKRAEERLARLHVVTLRLSGLLDEQEVARTVVEEARAAVGAVAAAVRVLDGGESRLLAADGEIDHAGGETAELPLLAEERALGSLVVQMAPGEAFTDADRVLLDVLGAACAQAMLLSQSLAGEQRTTALLDTVIEKAPEGWALFDRDLRYLRVNEALARINGVPAADHLGRQISEIVPDLPDEGWLTPLHRVLETGTTVELEVRGRTAADPDRDHVWRCSYYPVRDAAGQIAGVGVLVDDITERKRNEERAALLASLGPILEELVGVEQRLERLAHALIGTLGDMATVTLHEGETRDRVASAHVDPDRERVLAELAPTDETALGETTVVVDDATDELMRAVTRDDAHLARMRQVGYRSAVVAPMSVRGRRVGTLAVGSLRPSAFGPDEAALVEEVAKRAALAVDNARLYESERAARQRTARLQTVTAALSEALSPSDVGHSVLRAGMPAVGAQMGGVWQTDESGSALLPLAQEGYPDDVMGHFRNIALSESLPLTDAVREGALLYVPTLEERVARWPHLAAAFQAVGAGSLVILPLFARGEPIGAISLSFRRARTLDGEDLSFLESLASQCAQALERARLYEAERHVAATLQRSLLPQRLPSLESVEFAVRYLPAAGLAAGGDFYEAIRLPGGRIGVAVGDVVGRGAGAAASMGQLRSALRAFALAGAGPAEVLSRLSAFAETVDGALAATAAYAVLDPEAGELRYACAGHPWPLLAGADGEVRFLTGGRTVPLACMTDPVIEEAVEPLAPGDTLLLFTDGLTERRGIDMDVSMEGLRAAFAGRAGMPLAALLDAIVTDQDADAPMDDVALLAVRMAGADAAAHHLRMPAAPELIASARSQLRSWLAAAEVEPGAASDILLACGEALANAVEHAYRDELPGELELLVRTGHEVEVELRDYGSWKESAGDPDRGRGFGLMRALMHEVDVDRTPEGTTVRMRRLLAEPLPGLPDARVTVVREPVAPELRIESGDGGVRAVLEGDVDFFSSPEVGERLATAAEGGPLELDLTDAGYLDSAGARMLVELSRRVDLVLVAPPGSVARRALEVAGLDTTLGLRP